jgi:hypothetical protein
MTSKAPDLFSSRNATQIDNWQIGIDHANKNIIFVLIDAAGTAHPFKTDAFYGGGFMQELKAALEQLDAAIQSESDSA